VRSRRGAAISPGPRRTKQRRATTIATDKVTLTATDLKEVRRHLALNHSIEAMAHLVRKYRDAGMRLREAKEAVKLVEAFDALTGTPRKKPRKKKSARTRRRAPAS
jgi:hypothetical protein